MFSRTRPSLASKLDEALRGHGAVILAYFSLIDAKVASRQLQSHIQNVQMTICWKLGPVASRPTQNFRPTGYVGLLHIIYNVVLCVGLDILTG